MIAQRNPATARLGIALRYRLLAALTALAGVLAAAEPLARAGEATPADRRQSEWLGSRAGMSNPLLPPWTAVEVSGGDVSVGRVRDRKRGAFP